MMRGKSLSNNIIILAVLTVGLKVVGFISRSIVAYYFGTTNSTDVYYVASGFVDSISAVLLSGLTVGVVNIYIGHNKEKQREFVSNLFCLVSIATTLVGILCIALANPLSSILMKNESFETGGVLLQNMLRVLCIAFPFQGMISVMGATLQAEKDFVPVKITGTITSITNIVCVVILANKIGINALIVAYVSGAILNALFLFLSIRKKVQLRVGRIQINGDIKKLLSLIIPLTIGMAAHQVNLIIDKSIASSVVTGAVSALSYASFLYLFVENVIIQSVATAIFPEIVEDYQKTKDENKIAQKVRNTSLITLYFLIPIVVVCIANACFIIRVLYMRGNFGRESLTLTTAALNGYILGLPLLSVRDIANRVYYAYGDTRTPVIIGLFSVIINIVLDFILSVYLGVFGITIATSISNSLSAVMMIIFLKKYNSGIFNKYYTIEVIVLFVEMIGLTLLGLLLSNSINPYVSVVSIIIIAFVFEMFIAKVLHFKTYDTIVVFLKSIRRKVKNE